MFPYNLYTYTHYMIFYEPFKSVEYINPFLCMLCATWLPSLCICNYCYSANIHFISTIFPLTFHNNLLKYFPNRNLWNKPESKANHFFNKKIEDMFWLPQIYTFWEYGLFYQFPSGNHLCWELILWIVLASMRNFIPSHKYQLTCCENDWCVF